MNLNRYKRIIKNYGVEKKEFKKQKKILSEKFGKEASDNDIIWSLFNKLIILHISDLQMLKRVYYEMALFLDEEGKDNFQMRQQSSKMELLYYKKYEFIKKVKILAVKNGCKNCQKNNGRIFDIDKALEIMPLPNKDCTHSLTNKESGFCRCTWLSIID